MDIFMYWLSTLYMLGSRKQNLILDYFGDPRKAFEASADSLRSIPGMTENNIRIIEKNRDPALIQYGMEMLKQMNISFTYRGHKDYPRPLTDIPDAPVGLFYLGSLPGNALPRVAIIGSRRCSEYGLSIARKLGSTLSRRGVVIVSGMARGIDSMAHRGALEAEGYTIAVLGCSVDVCYPPENRALRDEIARSGCVISEYPPGVQPRASFFPARNRIISGLCQVLVVVEAGKKSGTLITVDQALEQGRDVMAVPGNITNKYSDGTNRLIKQGAEPLLDPEDVLHMLGLEVASDKKVKKEKIPNLASEEKLVYDVLASCPVTLDEIIIKTNSQAQTAQYILTMLELKGYVKKLPGMRYIRT